MQALMTEARIIDTTVVNQIDRLMMLDKQAKALDEEIKTLKAGLANEYGEGKHLGDLYSVTISLSQRAVVAWKKVAEEVNVPEEIINKYTSTTSIITVSPKA